MPRGPLPNPQRRRTNAPTIPTTSLPAAGRTGDAPAVPASANLGVAGQEWWEWAWHTPQACAWDVGSLYTVARRASMEDDLATAGQVESLDADDAQESLQSLVMVVRRLASLVTGRLVICREMRELDKVLGLTPKAMADLRWSIDKTEPEATTGQPPATVRRLRAVDPELAASGS